MDDLLPQLLSFPPHPAPAQKLSDSDYEKRVKSIVKLLNGTSASQLVRGVGGGGDLLDILDPAINTLPYLYTLLAHISNNQDAKQGGASVAKAFPPGEQLWQKMLVFMESFDPVQVRYAGAQWLSLVETVARSAETSQKPITAITPIRTAMLRLDPSTSCFTSTHLLFVRLCLHTKAFQDALPILDNDIFHFPTVDHNPRSSPPQLSEQHESSYAFITTSSGLSQNLNYQDHLRYFLYGAMLYLGLKNWKRTLLFLELVVVSPAINTASMIQVEAYKKWILVGLLLKGRPMVMPKNTNSQAAKFMKAIGKPYEVLANAFKDKNSEKLYAEFYAAQNVWQNDCNMGLVLQVLEASRRFRILRLERIYAAIPISVVAQLTSPQPENHAETEAYVTSLIASGQLNATLGPSTDSTKGSMLRFSTTSTGGPLARSETQQFEDLTRQTAKFVQLSKHIKATERRMELSKEYVDWARKNRRNKANGDSLLNHPLYSNDGYGIDEDLLADM
ncbi:hypothetical protein MMC30_008516 [Trapelia coarctata]|nr:hypothetical protein [Trapelia coarctata]